MHEARHERRKSRSWRFRSPHGEDQKSTRVVRMGWVQAEFVGTIVPSGRFELPTCGLGNRRSIHTELRGRDTRQLKRDRHE